MIKVKYKLFSKVCYIYKVFSVLKEVKEEFLNLFL